MASTPTFVGISNTSAGAGAISPAPTPSHITNDFFLSFIHTDNQPIQTTPTGWSLVTAVGNGTAGAAAGVMLTILKKVSPSANEQGQDIGDSGDHQFAKIGIWRGVSDVTILATDIETASVSNTTVPGGTSPVNNCLMLSVMAHSIDTDQAQITQWFNSSLDGVVSRADISGLQGNGGGFSIMEGSLVTAGVVSASTGTIKAGSNQVRFLLVLTPSGNEIGSVLGMGGHAMGSGPSRVRGDLWVQPGDIRSTTAYSDTWEGEAT